MKKAPKDYIKIANAGIKSLKLSFKAAPKLTFIYVSAIVLEKIIPVIQLILIKNLIDEIVYLSSVDDAQQILSNMMRASNITLLLGIYFALSILSNLFVTISFLAYDRLNHVLAKFTQVAMVNQSLALDVSFFEDADFYNQHSKVKDSIEFRLRRAVSDSANLLSFIVTFVSISVVLVSIHWVLIPVIIVLNLPVLIWGMGYSMVTHDLESSMVEEGRKANYLANLATDKKSIYEVKLFNLGNYLLGKYKKYFDVLMAETWKITKPKFIGAFFTHIISDITFFVFWVWAIFKTLSGIFTIGQLMLYQQAFSRASNALSGMLRYINDLYEHTLYIDDFISFLNLQPKIKDKKDALPLTKIEEIEFENVSFRYKENLPYVLENISFKINANENIALVGQNGAGKTTIIKLLMRFFDVTEGKILINNNDIKEYKLNDLWKNIGTVFQDFQQYQLSVQENIGFGQVEKMDNIEEISRAAKKSGADEFIEHLPDSYKTLLGTKFKNGKELSVGQWQKIAISRAFIRDSSIMILDEPTASIDAKAEYEVFRKFVELVEGKITILISHRFSTVRLASKILVIENGKLIETGTHSELLNKNGKYAEMFNLQAEGYK